MNDKEIMSVIEKIILKSSKEDNIKIVQSLIKVQNRLYSQLESLSWLQRCLQHTTQLPPLRNWASSPDVLLKLHNYITKVRPKTIVEFGSGASTLVIADALAQNGSGTLYSIDHSDYYGKQTQALLEEQNLQDFVSLRIAPLEEWNYEHLHSSDEKKQWYATDALNDIADIDLMWVDGPPGGTCKYSRYPAIPALSEKLSTDCQVWMDDTVRQEEKEICEDWAKKYGLDLTLHLTVEKGLGVLKRL